MTFSCGSSRVLEFDRGALAELVVAGLFVLAITAPGASGGDHDMRAIERAGLGDSHLHLFVDDVEISHRERVSRFINRPRKRADPVLVADQPWEGDRAQAWGSVIQEPDGLLRMWYFSFNTERRPDRLDCGGYAYAESRDGIHWKKPALRVVEFRGSKENNLFYTCAPDGKNLIEEELARRGLGLPAFDAVGKQLGVINNLDGRIAA